jgi:hypothetical protein
MTAWAQARQGGWIGIGVGIGPLQSSFADRDSHSETVGVSYIHFGGWARQLWMIGIDIGAQNNSIRLVGLPDVADPVTVLGTVAYYPSSSRGFYVKGGAGWLGADVDIVDEFGTKASAIVGQGFSYIAGTGWDVYIGKRFWLTPAVTFRYAHPGDLILGGQVRVANWSSRSVDVTLGVKFD